MHLSVAVTGLDSIHVEHVQFAAVALPPASLISARGESQIVHLSVAVAGLDSIHVEHVQFAPVTLPPAGFIPAAAQSKALTRAGVVDVFEAETPLSVWALKSKGGRDAFGRANASARALAYGEATEVMLVTEKTKVGKESMGTVRAASFAAIGFRCGVSAGAFFSSKKLRAGTGAGDGGVTVGTGAGTNGRATAASEGLLPSG